MALKVIVDDTHKTPVKSGWPERKNYMKSGGVYTHNGPNWIAGAIKKPGALHAEMGIPQGKPIPAGRLAKAAKAGGKLGQRARLAETLKGMH